MSTVMPQSELMRSAIRFIAEEREGKGKSMEKLLEEASMRFNLSPKECDYLKQFCSDTPPAQD
jgi:hypothetical protein